MGIEPTFLPQTKMQLLANSLFIGECIYPIVGNLIPLYKDYTYDSSIYTIQIPSTLVVNPSITLQANSNITACKPLTLTINNLNGFGNRFPKLTSFSCASGKALSSKNKNDAVEASVASINSQLIIIMNKWKSPQLNIILPANLLLTDVLYEFRAIATNFLNYSTITNISVTTTDLIYPTIIIQGLPNVVYPQMQFSIIFLSMLIYCNGSIANSDPSSFSYNLTQFTPFNQILSIGADFIFQTQNSIKIFPFRLISGTSYTFNIIVKRNDNPLLSTNSVFSINTGYQKPIAVISGSDQYIGSKQIATLNCSQSTDGNVNTVLTYQWSCTNISSQSFCFYENGTFLVLSNANVVLINGSLFFKGSKMLFTLIVCKNTDIGNICSSPANENVFIYDQDFIDLLQLDSSGKNGMIVNIQDPVLIGTYTNSTASQFYKYFWDIGNISEKCIQDLGSINAQSYIRFKAYTFTLGRSYLIKLTRLQINTTQNISIQVNISVNNPPTSGILVVDPSQGIEHSTQFTLQAIGWVDQDGNYPLSYKFGYKQTANSSIQYLSEKSNSSVLQVYLHSSKYPIVACVEVYDSLGAVQNYSVNLTVNSTTLDVRYDILKRMKNDNLIGGLSEFVGYIVSNENTTEENSLSLLQGYFYK